MHTLKGSNEVTVQHNLPFQMNTLHDVEQDAQSFQNPNCLFVISFPYTLRPAFFLSIIVDSYDVNTKHQLRASSGLDEPLFSSCIYTYSSYFYHACCTCMTHSQPLYSCIYNGLSIDQIHSGGYFKPFVDLVDSSFLYYNLSLTLARSSTFKWCRF